MTSWGCCCGDEVETNVEVAGVYAVFPDEKPQAPLGEAASPEGSPLSRQATPMSPMSRQTTPGSKMTSREFDAQVTKGAKTLGADIVMAKDRKAVIISNVKAGAIQEYNNAMQAAGNTDCIIKRGDRIVEVDGRGRGDSAEVAAALKGSSTIVDMKIVRLILFKVANIPNQPREVCGFTFAEGPKGELLLTGLQPAANKSLQPDVELRAGDRIVKVDGKAGTFAELKSEIGASDVVSLMVKRIE